jgi:hypothetical protein
MCRVHILALDKSATVEVACAPVLQSSCLISMSMSMQAVSASRVKLCCCCRTASATSLLPSDGSDPSSDAVLASSAPSQACRGLSGPQDASLPALLPLLLLLLLLRRSCTELCCSEAVMHLTLLLVLLVTLCASSTCSGPACALASRLCMDSIRWAACSAARASVCSQYFAAPLVESACTWCRHHAPCTLNCIMQRVCCVHQRIARTSRGLQAEVLRSGLAQHGARGASLPRAQSGMSEAHIWLCCNHGLH